MMKLILEISKFANWIPSAKSAKYAPLENYPLYGTNTTGTYIANYEMMKISFHYIKYDAHLQELTVIIIIGRAKRAPHWGVQSRFRVIYICRYVCRMSNHVESRESNTRMFKVSIGRYTRIIRFDYTLEQL